MLYINENKKILPSTALILLCILTNAQILSTDKAVYHPNDIVSISVDTDPPANSKIRYRFLDQTLLEINYSSRNWTWITPSNDFQGYLIDLYSIENGEEITHGSIGIDVSSDWTVFPRYGFLSKFPQLSNSDIDNVIESLIRFHINGLQFYDWGEKHHKPLAGTVANPSSTWFDIANRMIYKSTVQEYISKAKQAGMNTMSYNLCYGALNDAAIDGVQESWYIYTDAAHATKDFFDVPGFFKSPIYLLDPSNTDWQQYITARNTDMYSVYDFDGYHIDQLGGRGTVYNYSGGQIDLANSFNSFIQAMKTSHPGKKLVFNAVNQFGQQGSIATAPVDFLYTEIWSPNETYADLATIITNNDAYSSNTKKTVLAAYMNYNVADNPGSFNTPAVLFTDAVIFAFGGAHIELGEHMLGKEYFPNSNLQMPDQLKQALISYYDFSVAYQNLLRGGGTFNSPVVSITDNTYGINNWPPQQGKITVVGKQIGGRQVLHLLNFLNNTLDWRDTNGNKIEPIAANNINISYTTTETISNIWFASPDLSFGIAKQLTFQQTGNTVTFVVPSLKYWDMVVIGGCHHDSLICCYGSINLDAGIYTALKTESSETITSANTILPLFQVTFDAADAIYLKPGFTAVTGSLFQAFIDGCGGSRKTEESLVEMSGSVEPLENSIDELNHVQIIPNPFNSNFELSFYLQQDEQVKVVLYNSIGSKLKNLMESNLSKGINKFTFDGSGIAPGVYLIEINIGGEKTVRRLVKV